MTLFTYIAGIATILGFILQIRDVFPTHREARKSLLLLVCGVFIGSIIGSIRGIYISIQTPKNPLLMLAIIVLIVWALVLIWVAVFCLLTKDSKRREFLTNFLIVCLIGFGAMMLFTALAYAPAFDPVTKNLEVGEILHLSNTHVENRNNDRAINLMK